MTADITRELATRLLRMIEKADNIISAIDGVTDQFEPEVADLSDASSAAERTIAKLIGQRDTEALTRKARSDT